MHKNTIFGHFWKNFGLELIPCIRKSLSDYVFRKFLSHFTVMNGTCGKSKRLDNHVCGANSVQLKAEKPSLCWLFTRRTVPCDFMPWDFIRAEGLIPPTLYVTTKGIKSDCNYLMRTTYPDALRRGMLIVLADFDRCRIDEMNCFACTFFPVFCKNGIYEQHHHGKGFVCRFQKVLIVRKIGISFLQIFVCESVKCL